MKIALCWRTNISNQDFVYFIDFLYMYHYYSLIFITAKPINQPMVRFVYSYDEMYVILKILYFWVMHNSYYMYFPKYWQAICGGGDLALSLFLTWTFFSAQLCLYIPPSQTTFPDIRWRNDSTQRIHHLV